MAESDTSPEYLDGWLYHDDPSFIMPAFVREDQTELVDLILSGEIEP